MLASRLLMGGGGGSFSVPPPADDEDVDVLTVRVTHSENQTCTAPQNPSLADADPILFDTVMTDKDGATTPSGAWDAGATDRLTVPRDLVDCKVEVHLTTLGGDGGTVNYYGGWNNSDVVISVIKNWDQTGVYLDNTIAAVRCGHSSGVSAQIDELNQYVGDLTAGDVLQVVIAGPAGTLLVESNPSTPPVGGYPGNYRGQPGYVGPDGYVGFIGSHFVLRGV